MKKDLQVAWTDTAWDIRIRNRHSGGCRLDHDILRLVRSRFEPIALPPDMYRPVSLKSSRLRPGGFTLIELLVVIAIIAILAGITLPVLAKVKERAKVATTRTEMQGLAASIRAYEGDHNRNPASPAAEKAAADTDFTYGTEGIGLPPSLTVVNPPPIPPAITYNANNSELVVILMDIDQGVNANHVRNPRKNKYWNAKMVSSPIAGVSLQDYVARDPWGMPYIITLDMNDDNKVVDAIYGDPGVAERALGDPVGHVGLGRNAAGKFELNGPVMIWSFGPDKDFDKLNPAKTGVNRDNVLSWSN